MLLIQRYSETPLQTSVGSVLCIQAALVPNKANYLVTIQGR